MTNQFDPTAWNTGADLLDAAREAWETSSFQAAQSQPVSGNGSVPVDALLAKKTAELKLKWYDLIGEVGVAIAHGFDDPLMVAMRLALAGNGPGTKTTKPD